jgi:hypothetical protein
MAAPMMRATAQARSGCLAPQRANYCDHIFRRLGHTTASGRVSEGSVGIWADRASMRLVRSGANLVRCRDLVGG